MIEPILDDATLTELRKELLPSTFLDSCQIIRTAPAPDGAGGTIETETVVATLDCSVGPAGASPTERMVADRYQGMTLFVISLPYGTEVRDADRLRVTSGPTSATAFYDTIFEVVEPLAPDSFAVSVDIVAKKAG